jgi:hypothetical protein
MIGKAISHYRVLEKLGRGGMRKRIGLYLAQRKAGTVYASPYQISALYADLGDKNQAFNGSTPHSTNTTPGSSNFRPIPGSIPCAPIRVTPNWCAKSASRNE